jgi:hypothetical protein
MLDVLKLVWRQALLAVGLVPFRDYAQVVIMLDDERREVIRLQKQLNLALTNARDFVHNLSDTIGETAHVEPLPPPPDPHA